MNRPAQGMLLGLTGSLCLRLAITGEYRLYVNPWMRWPLLATALLLLPLGFRLLWTRAGIGGRSGPASAWLLVLPVVAVFAVSPPALGAYAAQRATVGVTSAKDYTALHDGPAIEMTVSEFQGRAQWDDTLTGYTVALTGFVTHGDGDAWYVTSLAISCCAADAVSYRVRVDHPGTPRPEQDSWVRVTGTWAKPSTTEVPRTEAPAIDATEVVPVAKPDSPFE